MDEEWIEELDQRDRALRAEMKEREIVFVNDKLMRDQELINLLEVREKEKKPNLLQKVEAFGYLYKEHHKEIKATIQKNG